MTTEVIKVSTGSLKDDKGEAVVFPINWERADNLDDLRKQGYSDEEIVSHVTRDEATNMGNAVRAKLVAAVKEGITDIPSLTKLCEQAATDYLSGEKTVRSRGGAAATLGKAIKWACTNAEVATAYAQAIASDGLEAANKVIVELYNEAHPAKEAAKAA